MKKKPVNIGESAASILEFSCDSCLTFGPVLAADGSYGEYSTVYLCHDCINKAFAAFKVLNDAECSLKE